MNVLILSNSIRICGYLMTDQKYIKLELFKHTWQTASRNFDKETYNPLLDNKPNF